MDGGGDRLLDECTGEGGDNVPKLFMTPPGERGRDRESDSRLPSYLTY